MLTRDEVIGLRSCIITASGFGCLSAKVAFAASVLLSPTISRVCGPCRAIISHSRLDDSRNGQSGQGARSAGPHSPLGSIDDSLADVSLAGSLFALLLPPLHLVNDRTVSDRLYKWSQTHALTRH